ncbi:putative enzyme related to lactoylglutathione lyase [Homoserinimonas aerilata]|uniref:Putative enzyme related to lactoylglutathione lyase n=1 Tax=Homoserinimonas aerilata TaxID=1162970 RepID=A0A542YHS7_9MICO|nr:VOC family protein [Homoserinimonas aerilata]TQL47660.1 putative enzyme related to lactoylglutathione lyase [Homoserinimonas aerilata]
MFSSTTAVPSFSVDDLDAAKSFYGETLGLKVELTEMGTLTLHFGGGGEGFVYPKPDHVPATFTVLNFVVDDVEAAVDDLNARGVTTKIYGDDVSGMQTDEKGIVRGDDGAGFIAWFRDPAGNVLAVLSAS